MAYRKEFSAYKGDPGKRRKAEQAVKRVLGRIKRKYHSLISAVGRLELKAVQEEVRIFDTDGKHLFFQPEKILKLREPEKKMGIAALHIIMHGILGHFENVDLYKKRRLNWDVMDLTVTRLLYMMGEMAWDDLNKDCMSLLELSESELGSSLYYKAEKDKALQRKIRRLITMLEGPGALDDHAAWALPSLKNGEMEGEGSPGDDWKEIRMVLFGSLCKDEKGLLKNPSRVVDLLSGGSCYGNSAGNGEKDVEAEGKAIRSYRDLIDELSSSRETVREEDILDPILYTYGLELYGDVPLVEPVELAEHKSMNSVVVAVDTSGSCTNELDRFWEETLGFYREIASDGGMKKLHFLECDTGIQFEKCYESAEELLSEEMHHGFHGLGGTSFEPVFEKAQEYIKEGEIIDCMIYFSDGWGSFPKEKPEYPVYFVLPHEEGGFFTGNTIPEWVEVINL